MMGYYKNEEATRDILREHEDGKIWVHTGDIGRMDEDGFITIVGRIKRMILTSEKEIYHKVFPKILETEFLKTGIIDAISIVGKPNINTTNDLVAFVVLCDGYSEGTAIQALEKYAQDNLETYERPVRYVVVEKLPLTTVGKVDYRALEKEAAKE